ncbi:IclR family transcriptional regulator [Leifsonia sp. H3M29-4]|uniref:IclR family transcriptional regulator n=1 Tax=Salinibacterium metalliresistens TaxID=3031321 RepID=UPI0023DA63A0|nr:IclR family transcriptional regulator [Salinibacterium metalliresistens]MDF1480384.1 IclR family transcriptional regulator [Salinibacterium metalliresistens]
MTEASPPDSVLGRAFTILGTFLGGESDLSMSELSRRCNLPRPTIHRMVVEMVSWGMLERTSRGVRLGLRLFELGQLVPRQRDLRYTAMPILSDLAAATRQTIHLAVMDGGDVVYVDKLQGPNGPALPSRVGGRMPPYCTALGKAQLAFSDASLVKQVILTGMPRRTPRTIVDPRIFFQQLVRIRETGVAFEFEESTRGIVCVASPVFNEDNQVIAAISVSGWLNLLNVDRVDPAVKTAASMLSRQLGATRPMAAAS